MNSLNIAAHDTIRKIFLNPTVYKYSIDCL